MIVEELKIWAAGFFDGEGSALIERTAPKTYQIVVAVVNTSVTTIDIFQDAWGGKRTVKPKEYLIERSKKYTVAKSGANIKRDGIELWFSDHDDAKRFLLDIYPYLITKRKDVNILLRALLRLPKQEIGATGKTRVPRGSSVLLKPFYEELQNLRNNRDD